MSKYNKNTKGCLGIWVAGASLLISSSVHAGIPVWTYSAPSPARVAVSDGGTATVQYTVTNQSRKAKNLILRATPGLSASSCHLAGKGSTCSLTLSINGSLIPQQGIHAGPVLCEQGNPNQCYQPSAAHVLNVSKNTANTTSLQVSVSELALSVGGSSRTITITNTGSADATDVSYTLSSALPNDASIAPLSCGTIPSMGTCVLTISPGATPTAAPGDLNPEPVAVQVSGSNTNIVSSAINIIAYGSVYQGGYVFAIDDTPFPEQSVKGKVLAKTYQAKRYNGGITWGAYGTEVGGINQNSAAGSNSCDGKNDGACNTGRIIARLTEQNPPDLPVTDYAAGLCKAEIDGHADWYLPAICEMGPASNGSGCSSGTGNIVTNLANLLGTGSINPNDDPDTTCQFAVDYTGTVCLAGYYWSSTEYAVSPQSYARTQFFAASGSSFQTSRDKVYQNGVRCVRGF